MMMTTSRLWPCILLASACGSQRVAGYVDDLANCSATTSETTTTNTASTSSASDETSSSTADAESTSETTTSSTSTSTDETTDATPSTTTDTTTDTPAPVCGNGMLEPIGPVPEECDDGNLVPDDGCSDTCARDVRVFVTSETYQADKIGGLSGADTRCSNLADDQGWPDGLKYRAWLSDSTTDAIDRFSRGRGRLVMPNGLVLAKSWSALLAGQLDNPFEVTETNLTFHGIAWTGTRPEGIAVPGAQHCDDWTTSSFTKFGHYGYTDRPTSEWTFSLEVDNPIDCGSAIPLYCIESL